MPKVKSGVDFTLLSLVWVLFLWVSVACGQSVVINEFMASNDQTLADNAGDYDDWIELYNPTDQAVDVGGMFLTDDLNDLTQWQFPTDQPTLTTIGPDGYLLVWADKDSDDFELHADFKLSADGESVGLVSGGALIDSVTYGEQVTDVSWGRNPDDSDTWVYMATPTPGTANVEGLLGMCEPVSFSVTRGFYDEPVSVTLTTTTPDAEIWVTLNGDMPHFKRVSSRGSISYDGDPYTGPITVETTTCIRAVAIKAGWQDSEVVSHSYLYLDDVIEQNKWPDGAPTKWNNISSMNGHSIDYQMDPHVVQVEPYCDEIKDDLLGLPTMCIVMPNDDFFGDDGFYSNGSREGDEWERVGTLEWIDPETGANFGVNSGFRSHGGVGRAEVKHSIRSIFRGEYGLSKLEFPLFKDSSVDTFDQLIFRATWNYSWIGDSTACSGIGTENALYLRETFARDTSMEMGLLAPSARHIHLYVNGLYWGVYILSERPDESFAAEHLGGSPDDYDVLKAENSSTPGMEIKAGDDQAWDLLFDLAEGDLSSQQAYEALWDLVDINDMIDYMLMIYYVGSRDAPVLLCNDNAPRNFYAIRDRNALNGYLFIPWDCEWSLESEFENRVEIVGELNPHYLMYQLRANDEFLMLVADHVYRNFFNDGPLTEDASIARFMKRADEIYGPIVGESARWGDLLSNSPYTRDDHWIDARDELLDDYFPRRTQIVLGQLQDEEGYPSINPPTFEIDGTEMSGGQVQRGATLVIQPAQEAEFEDYGGGGHGGGGWPWPWSVNDVSERAVADSTTYYTLDGTDPRARGGQVAATALTYHSPLTLTATTHIKTRALTNDGEWSALHEVVFAIDPVAENLRVTELMYHPDDPNAEFIELSNIGDETINLAYVQLSEGVEFTFPNLDLAPLASVVVVADTDVFTSLYGNNVTVAGVYDGRLSNDQDRLVLSDALGTVIHDFVYDDQWQPATDGQGASLVILDPYADVQGWSEPGFWTASSLLGTPGLLQDATDVVNPGPVVISEIMYHPRVNDDAEYIELTNISDRTVTLYDAQTWQAWEITGGVEFTFSGSVSVTLAAGESLLLVKDAVAFEAAYGPIAVTLIEWGTDSLANSGDELILWSPSNGGQLADQVRFSDGMHGGDFAQGQDPWPVAADGMGRSLGRVSLTGWGNFVDNWQAIEPNPGQS